MGGILRRRKDKKRREKPVRRLREAPISTLRERARNAAEAIHSDNSCRWFPLADVFPVYNYLYDYYRGGREDARTRRQAEQARARLADIAQRLEANALHPLPPEWEEAKVALAEASEVFRLITQAW